MLNSDEVRRAALEVGFDDCGVARAEALGDGEYPLRRWLAGGCNGSLSYMERNVAKRQDPRLLVPGARSVICVASAYPPPTGDGERGGEQGRVAAYARTREYHKVIKDMLFALRERLGIDGKVCCDTAPISDKRWAARAGLGWIGRHTLLVTRRWGSWVNLGEIVTTEECDRYGAPLPSGCTGCDRCTGACPNHALDGGMLDASRCAAAYNTHNPQSLPDGLSDGGYAVGCDICQLACPLNAVRN